MHTNNWHVNPSCEFVTTRWVIKSTSESNKTPSIAYESSLIFIFYPILSDPTAFWITYRSLTTYKKYCLRTNLEFWFFSTCFLIGTTMRLFNKNVFIKLQTLKFIFIRYGLIHVVCLASHSNLTRFTIVVDKLNYCIHCQMLQRLDFHEKLI